MDHAALPPPKNEVAFFLLPRDITTNILTRLSAKVLCKLRCVSKFFSALISDPHFIQCHSSRANPLAVVILAAPYEDVDVIIRILDTGEGEGDGNVVREIRNLDFLRYSHVFHTRLNLLCIVEKITCLLDPATEQYTLLPPSNNNINNRPGAILGFGQVASTGEYKIVSLFYNYNSDDHHTNNHLDSYSSQICEVFTLGGGSRQWRVAQPPPFMLHCMGASYFIWTWSSALVNGEIYVLSRLLSNNFVDGIVCFNLEREEWRVLTPPPGMQMHLGKSGQTKVTEVNGFLCLTYCGRSTFDLWFFNKNGDEEWTKDYIIYLPPIYESVCPLAILPDGRILLLQKDFELFLYDPKEEVISSTLLRSDDITSVSLYGSSVLSLTS